MLDKNKLCCPCAEKYHLEEVPRGYRCLNTACIHNQDDHLFGRVDRVPVLISNFRCDTLWRPQSVASLIERRTNRFALLRKILSDTSRTTRNNCRKFLDIVLSSSSSPSVLVIGGGERGSGADDLYMEKGIVVTSVDIYHSQFTDLLCDGHYLPFKAESFDGVWIQAVLEHVVDPRAVVDEIHRVLTKDGVVYAETPFMQQVHEGPYDFNRFTVLGHRYLFRDFSCLDVGGNKGADVVLAWSIKYFVWALSRNRVFSIMVGMASGLILRIFRNMLSVRALFDSSSGVYFMGKKSDKRIRHADLPELYKGLSVS